MSTDAITYNVVHIAMYTAYEHEIKDEKCSGMHMSARDKIKLGFVQVNAKSAWRILYVQLLFHVLICYIPIYPHIFIPILLYFAWADQRVQLPYRVKLVVIELWLDSYTTLE